MRSGVASAGGATADHGEQSILYTRDIRKAFLLCESARDVLDARDERRNVDKYRKHEGGACRSWEEGNWRVAWC